jgi:hypothetical protein
MKKLFLFIAIFYFFQPAYTQITFHFAADLYGSNVDGLGMFQIQNTGVETLRGHISISVTESSGNTNVLIVTTPSLIISPGLINFSKSTFHSSAINFYANSWGALANQTRKFPPGEYSFCFRFIPDDKSLIESENCVEATILPVGPLNLIIPSDEDTICLKRPQFMWQPPVPFTASMKFRFLLTEKKQSTPAESILMDNPLIALDNLSSTSLNYPAVYPDLKEGKTYCWQVYAYEQSIMISKSDIWEFTVQCKENIPAMPIDSYRELKQLVNGNYYIAYNYFRFSFLNSYNISLLKYEIIDVSTNRKIKNLPDIKIQTGFNKIDIDLSDDELKSGQHYILKVYPFNEQPVEVRFIYVENN